MKEKIFDGAADFGIGGAQQLLACFAGRFQCGVIEDFDLPPAIGIRGLPLKFRVILSYLRGIPGFWRGRIYKMRA